MNIEIGRRQEKVNRFSNYRLLWEALGGGKYHPFQVRALKAEILHRTGSWEILISMLGHDLACATAFEMSIHQGWCLLKLGLIDSQRSNFEEARRKISLALLLYTESYDSDGSFQCRANLMRINFWMREYELAEKEAGELLKEAKSKGDDRSEIQMLNNLGMIYINTDRYIEALNIFEQTIEASNKMGNQYNVAHALGNIGNIHFDQGRFVDAASFYSRAIKICQYTGDRYTEYISLYNLAQACEKLGQNEEAFAHYQQDLAMALQLGDEPGQQTLRGDLTRVGAAIAAKDNNARH